MFAAPENAAPDNAAPDKASGGSKRLSEGERYQIVNIERILCLGSNNFAAPSAGNLEITGLVGVGSCDIVQK